MACRCATHGDSGRREGKSASYAGKTEDNGAHFLSALSCKFKDAYMICFDVTPPSGDS
jgi:hypothetical protein